MGIRERIIDIIESSTSLGKISSQITDLIESEALARSKADRLELLETLRKNALKIRFSKKDGYGLVVSPGQLDAAKSRIEEEAVEK